MKLPEWFEKESVIDDGRIVDKELEFYTMNPSEITFISSNDPSHIQKAQKICLQITKSNCNLVGLGKSKDTRLKFYHCNIRL